MRRVLYTLAGAVAVVAFTASVAAGAGAVKCGTRYKPRCTSPFFTHIPVNVACHQAPAKIHLASFTAFANAGIKRVTITVHSRTLTILSVRGHGALKKKISGITINTAGLATGAHAIIITVVDERGKTTTTTYHFAICKPKPVFTG